MVDHQGVVIKWELEKAKTFGDIKIKKERLQLARTRKMPGSC